MVVAMLMVFAGGSMLVPVGANHCFEDGEFREDLCPEGGVGNSGDTYEDDENLVCDDADALGWLADTDDDGTVNCRDNDDDGDGLTDKLERIHPSVYDHENAYQTQDIDNDNNIDGKDIAPAAQWGAFAFLGATIYDRPNGGCNDPTFREWPDPVITELKLDYGAGEESLADNGYGIEGWKWGSSPDDHRDDRGTNDVGDLKIDDGDPFNGGNNKDVRWDDDEGHAVFDLHDSIHGYDNLAAGERPHVDLTIGMKDHDSFDENHNGDRMDLTDGAGVFATLSYPLINDIPIDAEDEPPYEASDKGTASCWGEIGFVFGDTAPELAVLAALCVRDNYPTPCGTALDPIPDQDL